MMKEPYLVYRDERLSLDQAREKVPDGIVAESSDDGAIHLFDDRPDLEQRAPELKVDPTTAVPLPPPPEQPPEPVYLYRGDRLDLDEARARGPDGVVYAGPESQADGVFYVFDSDAAMPDEAARLDLDPARPEKGMGLKVPAQVVFSFRGRDLTLEELKRMKDPIVLAGPNTDVDGRFYVYDPNEDLTAQAKRIGLDPELMRKWKESQSAA